MKKLYCHTSLKDMSGDYMVKVGETYTIVAETLSDYEIIDEQGFEHAFSKEPDDRGLSYKDWFELIRNWF